MFAFQPLFLFFVRRCLLFCVDVFMFILEIVLDECVFAVEFAILFVWESLVVQGCTSWVIMYNPGLLLYPVVPATLWTLFLVPCLHVIMTDQIITPRIYTFCKYFVVCFWLAVYFLFCQYVITPEVAAYMAYNGYELYTIKF